MKKKLKNKNIVVAAISVLILGCIIGAYFLFAYNPRHRLDSANFKVVFGQEQMSDGGNTVTLQYPKISEYADYNMTETINSAIYNAAFEHLTDMGLSSADDQSYSYEATNVTINCETPGYFSSSVFGNVYSNDAEAPEYFSYSINCDTKTGALYGFEELVSDFDGIKELFCDGSFEAFANADELTEGMTRTDLFAKFNKEYKLYPSVYFSEDTLWLMIDLPAAGAGTVKYKIDVDAAKDYLNRDNPVVKIILD